MSFRSRIVQFSSRARHRFSESLGRVLTRAGTCTRPALEVLKEAGAGWQRHKAARMAAAIAYHGIFSLAPIIVIMVGVAGLWFGQEAAEGLIVERLRDMLGDDGAGFVQSLLARVYTGGGGVAATVIAGAVLLYGASRVIGGVRGALNDIWEVQPRAGGGIKGFVLTKLFDLGMVLVVGFMFLATMVANAAASAWVRHFSNVLPLPDAALRAAGVVFSLVVVIFFVTIIFRLLPNIRPPWRDVLVGSMVTAVLFSLGNYVIGIYLGRAGLGSVFGAAGSLAVIMIWIYYSMQIILFGAEITRARQAYRSERRHAQFSPFPLARHTFR